jgi:Uma2 family endonuclease
MAHPIRILPHYTYSDYCRWEGQWELIDGIPYAMSPAPLPKHQVIASNLSVEFGIALKKCRNCTASQPVDYLLADDTILQPDFLVYCGKVTKSYLDFPPKLIAEILSPSTALKDRHTKYSLYETAGVLYYLIINPATEEVEVYEWKDGSYRLAAQGRNIQHSFIFDEGCMANIDFAEIW